MPEPAPINLIRVFDFYLAVMFFLSLLRRWDVYLDAVYILFKVRGRWPKLLQRLGEHKSVLLNWSFFRPAVVALLMMLVQLVCSRLIWPKAVLTAPGLQHDWWWIPVILAVFVPMVAVDVYFLVRVGRFDRGETVKYFDQAENWLGWKGPLVRVFTLGIVNPRKMVDQEVQKSLDELGRVVNAGLWWVSVQIALRVAFGLLLWTAWAVHS